jgi:hypothetical protein
MADELGNAAWLLANVRDVASKVIDGEAIVINLTNGRYYSMDNVSGYVWSMIVNGAAIDGIVDAVSAQYSVSAAEASRDVHRFVRDLLEENLITLGESAPAVSPVNSAHPASKPYAAPMLNRYDDMADIFALDPPLPELPPLPPDGGTTE